MVAWYLDVPILRVTAPPTVDANGVAIDAHKRPITSGWPNVILQDRDTRRAPLLPLPQTIRAWEADGAPYSYSHVRTVRVFTDCRK
jgi:hypothetical protein